MYRGIIVIGKLTYIKEPVIIKRVIVGTYFRQSSLGRSLWDYA